MNECHFAPERPLSEDCARVVEQADHALVAVSLFNGYYNRARLQKLIAWADRRFTRFDLPIFDYPHAYTLTALGQSTAKAVQRARHEGRKLHRRLDGLCSNHATALVRTRLLTWDDLCRNERYQALCLETERAYHVDADFRRACIDMTDRIVDQVGAGAGEKDDVRAIAVRYLLYEMPLFLDTAGIVGARMSVFCYHRAYEFHQRLFNREFSIVPSVNQAFLVLPPADAARE